MTSEFPKHLSLSRRRVSIVIAAPKGVAEIEVQADAACYGIEAIKGGIILVFGYPEGTAIVKRKLWTTAYGSEVAVDAQQGHMLGTVIVEEEAADQASSAAAGGLPKRVLYAVFLETEEQALARKQHRSGMRG